MGVQEEEKKRPTYFDLTPLLKALKKFLAYGPEQRSFIRTKMLKNHEKVRNVF